MRVYKKEIFVPFSQYLFRSSRWIVWGNITRVSLASRSPFLRPPMYKYVFPSEETFALPAPRSPLPLARSRDTRLLSGSSSPTCPRAPRGSLSFSRRRGAGCTTTTQSGILLLLALESSRVGARRICHPHQRDHPSRQIVSSPSTCSASDDDATASLLETMGKPTAIHRSLT